MRPSRYESAPTRHPLPISRREWLRLTFAAGFAGTSGVLLPPGLRAEVGAASAETPTLSGPQVAFYRFRIGDIEALALSDGGFAVPPADSPFGVGEPREKIAEALDAALLPADKVHVPFTVLLVRIGGELILVDTGAGALFGPAGGRLVSNLEAAGLRPTDITGIVITHMHGDHFGGLLDAASGKPAFPNAAVFLHRREHAFWSGPECEALGERAVSGVRRHLEAFAGRWQLLGGGDRPVDGMEILDAPGHTPGHINLLLTSGSEQLLHIVDVAHHHVLSFAHPEWAMRYDLDREQAIRTRERVLDRAAADRLRIFGAHMPFPGLGRVRREKKGYRYEIEPWISA